MAIYVYQTSTGNLLSWCPDSLTVAQAQSSGQVASDAYLTANGLTAVDSLPALDSTHQWSSASKTVIVVTAPTPANVIDTFDFIMAFTPTELAGIRASTDNNVQQFLFALQVTQGVNLNHTTIQNALTYLVNHSLLTQPRANTILSTVTSGAT